MQDCSPICLDFPEEAISAMKDHVNNLTGTKFARAGLGKGSLSTILILDTPRLRTTRMLFSRFVHGIGRLIIVEIDSGKVSRMRETIAREFRDCPIEVVNAEVVDYLQTSREQIDFIWLDLQSDRFELAHRIKYHLTHARCFAVTIAARSRANGTVASRVEKITKSIKRMLPHLVVDFGYQLDQTVDEDVPAAIAEKHAPMQLLVYSKYWSLCDYHLGRDKHGNVFIYGYPMTRRNYQPRVIAETTPSRKSLRLLKRDPRASRVHKRRAQF